MKYHAMPSFGYQNLMETYQIHSLLAKYLDVSGHNEKEIADFMSTPHPFVADAASLRDACKRLQQAKQQQEKVFVFGDYDTDGICSTAMMTKLLESMGLEVGYYIPNRFEEGYGLNTKRVQDAHERGYQLIVTVDNGVKAHEALRIAKQYGMDVIVVDHHTIEEDVDCTVLVHPSTLGEGMQYLCGSGCVLQIVKYLELPLAEYLPLAMIATIGDVMELKYENRWIVSEGLRLLRQGACRNMARLLNGKVQDVDARDVAFQIVPKCNAIGRLADRANVNTMVRYLLNEDEATSVSYAQQLIALNQTRRDMTEQHMAALSGADVSSSFPVLADASFHAGIVGLVATRLQHALHKPVMVVAVQNEMCHGSIRGISSFHVLECLKPIGHLFTAYGGHAMAAGVSFPIGNLPLIRSYLAQYPYEEEEMAEWAIEVTPEELSAEALREWFAHAPYGKGWEDPLWMVEGTLQAPITYMKKETYIKASFADIEAVWFNEEHSYREYVNATKLRVIGRLQKRFYLRKEIVQLQAEWMEKR